MYRCYARASKIKGLQVETISRRSEHLAHHAEPSGFRAGTPERVFEGPFLAVTVCFDRALEAAPGLSTARLMKADRAGHIILEIAAGLRDEQYLGEAQETPSALMEEYNVAWQLSPPGNQRDILDLERTLFSEDWSGLPAQIQKAMQPGGCSQMNWTDVFIGPFGWAEQVSEKSRETLSCDPMAISPSTTRPFQLIYSGSLRQLWRSPARSTCGKAGPCTPT